MNKICTGWSVKISDHFQVRKWDILSSRFGSFDIQNWILYLLSVKVLLNGACAPFSVKFRVHIGAD